MLVSYQCIFLVALVLTVSEADLYGCQHAYIQIFDTNEDVCDTVSNINMLSGDERSHPKCGVTLKCEQTSLTACITGGYEICEKITSDCDKLLRRKYDAGENLNCAYGA